jgi:hypothetical protein
MKEVKRHQGQQFRRFQDDDGNFHIECKKCKKIKPQTSEFFYKQKTTKSGLRSICKPCCDDYHMNRYENEEGFKERVGELRREWSRNNPEKVAATAKKSRERAKAKDPEGFHKRNREKVNEWKARQPAGIYRITCLENGRVYIGESKCIPVRWISHKSALNCEKGRTNKLLQEDWDLYGESSFAFEILEQLEKDKDLLYDRELFYIKQFDEKGFELYNRERLEDK